MPELRRFSRNVDSILSAPHVLRIPDLTCRAHWLARSNGSSLDAGGDSWSDLRKLAATRNETVDKQQTSITR